MQIVNVDGIFDGIEAEVIGFAIDHTSSKTAACHPNAEGSIVMVSAVVATLDHRCATELAPPDDQGVFEQPEPLERLPFIVVVIDELADLMWWAKRSKS